MECLVCANINFKFNDLDKILRKYDLFSPTCALFGDGVTLQILSKVAIGVVSQSKVSRS